jgi:hypothetical protein
MGRECSTSRREQECIQDIFVREPEGNRPLEKPISWWVDNIKVDRREIE